MSQNKKDDLVKVVGMLIEHGADVTAQTQDGWTPLHLAIQGRNGGSRKKETRRIRVRKLEVINMLIKRGADVSALTKDGRTPLHLAVQIGQVEVVGILIEHGADVTAEINSGSTLLHLALEKARPKVACMLIKHGADVTARTEGGWSPLHLAIRCGQVTHLQVIEVVSMLIEHGADVNLINNGLTLLHLAVLDGNPRINGKLATMLIKHGADVAARTADGSTPLHLASQEGQLEAARILIESGADVSAQDNNGSTPLHLVSTPQNLHRTEYRTWTSHFADIASMLLECGADLTVRNKDGRTPFDLIYSRPKWGTRVEEVAGVLLQHEAIKSRPGKPNETSSHQHNPDWLEGLYSSWRAYDETTMSRFQGHPEVNTATSIASELC